MGGTTVGINIGSVRIIVDHIGFCLEGVEHALRNSGRASVGTVKTHFDILEITAGNGDQISDITVSSGSKIYGSANLRACRQRQLLQFSIQIRLDPRLDLRLDLLSVSVQ